MPLKTVERLRAEDGAPAAGRLFHERVDAAPPETGLTSIIGRMMRASLSQDCARHLA